MVSHEELLKILQVELNNTALWSYCPSEWNRVQELWSNNTYSCTFVCAL